MYEENRGKKLFHRFQPGFRKRAGEGGQGGRVSSRVQVVVMLVWGHDHEGIFEIRSPSRLLLGPDLVEALPTDAAR